jgi:flavin reductase (DIM6/NTAB) family NADH-FMN oxidoreductase RutF
VAIDLELFRSSMQRLAAGVTIVATGSAGDRTGLTASAVTSLTGEPPTLLACVSRDSGSLPALVANGLFSVNVLARDQEAVATAFAGMTGLEGEERFTVGAWSPGLLGVPLLEGALVGFECVLEARFPRSSHDILVGRIDHASLSHGALDPLLYVDRRFGGFDA